MKQMSKHILETNWVNLFSTEKLDIMSQPKAASAPDIVVQDLFMRMLLVSNNVPNSRKKNSKLVLKL